MRLQVFCLLIVLFVTRLLIHVDKRLARWDNAAKWYECARSIFCVGFLRIKKLVVSCVLMAMIGCFFSGLPIRAEERSIPAGSTCHCMSHCCCMPGQSDAHAGAVHRELNTSASRECGCRITSIPDTQEAPAVMPQALEHHDFDDLVSVMPVSLSTLEHPVYLRGLVSSESAIYEFFNSSSLGSRAPPL